MATTSTAAIPYGVVTLDGLQYIERPQIFTLDLTVTQPFQVFTNQRLTMPGVANFLLKGLTRDITIPPGDWPASNDRRFRFKLTNAEGSTWFFSGGLGIFDDRVIDTACFGTGQFPYPLIPPVPVHASGTLIFEVEDMGVWFPPAGALPYTIHFGFHGSYLIPVEQAGQAQSILYSVEPGT